MKEEKKIDALRPNSQNQPLPPPVTRRSCFNFRNCCLSCLALFVAFIVLILILIALSGLLRIPLLSPLLYGDGPKPSRVVIPEQVNDKYFENLFKSAGATNQNTIMINENVLSYMINDFANKENNVLVPESERTKGSQIALEDGYAEFFYKPLSPRTTLTAKIITVPNGYKAQKIKIGKLRVPVFIANFFFSRFFNSDSIYSTSGIKSIKFERGKIVIEIDPALFKGENSEEAPVPLIPQ